MDFRPSSIPIQKAVYFSGGFEPWNAKQADEEKQTNRLKKLQVNQREREREREREGGKDQRMQGNSNSNSNSNSISISKPCLRKGEKKDLFHVLHKVPSGDSPYVRAKHLQLVEKDPEAAIVLFWKAINEGDRVDSALKDMAIVMKQQDRAEEAIEAIKSFRNLCSKQAQESLDNVLIDLYKKCGKVEEQIELLKRKLTKIYQGEVFNGKATKTARSHGKKFQVSVKQETSRILGNLGWAYMQQSNYAAAEVVYRKAQQIDPDANKARNLGLCLMKQGQYEEARSILEDVLAGSWGSDDCKSRNRAEELIQELELQQRSEQAALGLGLVEGLDLRMEWAPFRSRRLPIFEEISQFRDQMAC